MGTKITRKQFIKKVVRFSAAVVGLTQVPIPTLANVVKQQTMSKNGISRIVIIRNPAVQNATGVIDKSILQQMLNQAVVRFTGEKSNSDAWKSLFKPTDVVGIKVNCLGGRNMRTSPELAEVIAICIQSAGVKEENIIIWDRNTHELKAVGFKTNQTATGVKCYGTDGDFDEKPTRQGSVEGKLSRILTEKITALINVPILKDHGCAGITLAMKNHYGLINNPGSYHGNNCDPYCADLSNVPIIRKKTKLIICDAIRPLANGGPSDRPQYRWNYSGIIIGTDPVALDQLGWQIIESRRKEIGLPTLTEQGRPPKYIATAASIGVGTNDPNKMQIIQV